MDPLGSRHLDQTAPAARRAGHGIEIAVGDAGRLAILLKRGDLDVGLERVLARELEEGEIVFHTIVRREGPPDRLGQEERSLADILNDAALGGHAESGSKERAEKISTSARRGIVTALQQS